MYSTLLFTIVFNLNEPESQLITYSTALVDFKSYLPFVLVYKFSFAFNTKLTKYCLSKLT